MDDISRWHEVSEILDTLLFLPREEQLPYLEKNYGQDRELVEQVKLMLESIYESEERDFLSKSAFKKTKFFRDSD